MKLNIKALMSVIVPILIILAGGVFFAYWYFPEKGEYKVAYENHENLMRNLEMYERSSGNTAVRGVVTQLERELAKIKDEFQTIHKYLSEKYKFNYVAKYAKLTGLDFKNLIVEKRKALKRSQIGFEEYDSTIPKTEDIPDLVKRLEIVESIIKTLQSKGVTAFDDIQVSPGLVVKNSMTETDIYEEFAATFRVTAPYGQIKNLLYALEHSSVFMIVNYCRISEISAGEVRADIAVKAVRFLFQV